MGVGYGQAGLVWCSPWGRKQSDTTEQLNLTELNFIRIGFPGGLVVKNLPANAGDPGSISGLGSSPGEENGNLFQYSCLLGNPMDRGVWWAIINGIAKESDTT